MSSFSVVIALPNTQVGALLASILVDEARGYTANFNTEYTSVTLSSETRENVSQGQATIEAIINQIVQDITRKQALLPRKYAPLFHMPQGEEAVRSVELIYNVKITFTYNDLSIESLSRTILQTSQQGLVCARHLCNVTVSGSSNGEDAAPSAQPSSATWRCNGSFLPPRESQRLEDLFQFGGQQVGLLGDDYTIDFREMKAIGISGVMQLERLPSTPIPEQQILLNVVGLDTLIATAISNLKDRLNGHCKGMSISLGTQPLSSPLRQQVTNFCRQYCIDFSYRTNGTQQLLHINGPHEYLDRVYVLIHDFVRNLPPPVPPRQRRQSTSPSPISTFPVVSPRRRQSTSPSPIARAVISPAPAIVRQPVLLPSTPAPSVSFTPPAASQAPRHQMPLPHSATSTYPVPHLWTPQLQDCEFKPVARHSQEWNEIVSQVKVTLTTADVTGVERIQNRPLWERYCLEGRQMSSRNNGETNERYLFHGTRSTDPRQVVQSDSGIDFRYSARNNRLMWGNGAYFAENASYSNSYSYDLGNRRKQMLIVSVLTGISYHCGKRKEPHLTKPPERVPNRLYDTVYGESAGSGIYVVYDHFKSCPAYLITYINQP